MRIGIIIPALNEASCIGSVVTEYLNHAAADDELRVVVCDNGSIDDTAEVARNAGAEVVHEPHRGYGAACLRALAHLANWPDVVAFVDGDGSTDPADLAVVLDPICRDQADLVIGCRQDVEPSSMTMPQRVGNRLTCSLIRFRWGFVYRDCGPLRALTRPALKRLDLRDRTWGWNVEMQIRALLCGVRVAQVPVGWRRRIAGKSKISGTAIGVLRAGGKILGTFLQHAIRPGCVDPAPRDIVLVFVKYPHPGQVKTRLASAVGPQRAAEIYERLARDTHREVLKLQSAGRTDVVVYGAGHDVGAFERWLPGARYYWPQPDGTLAARLQGGFAKAFARGARCVAAIGSDYVGLGADVVGRALSNLRYADVVVVSATDGGYALIGLWQHRPELFADIDWSTPRVMAQTLERAEIGGLTVRELPPLSDVDTAEDLTRLLNEEVRAAQVV